jgi:hypothetical protein
MTSIFLGQDLLFLPNGTLTLVLAWVTIGIISNAESRGRKCLVEGKQIKINLCTVLTNSHHKFPWQTGFVLWGLIVATSGNVQHDTTNPYQKNTIYQKQPPIGHSRNCLWTNQTALNEYICTQWFKIFPGFIGGRISDKILSEEVNWKICCWISMQMRAQVLVETGWKWWKEPGCFFS